MTPIRDRNIPATAWIECPESLQKLGDDLPGVPVAEYKRRIGHWLLWRAGPAVDGDARYWAANPDDFDRCFTYRLFVDGTGEGVGPNGAEVDSFRAWKQSLLAASRDQ